MAQRRMFSKTVTDSARFLRMPMEARLLYYDLGMAADDDGCAEGYTVLLKNGTREEHLRLLEEKGFLKILNEDLVVYLLDWGENNRIRKDRYHKSAYWSLVEKVLGLQPKPDVEPEAQPIDNQTVTDCQPNDNQPETAWQPNDNQVSTNCQPDTNQTVTKCQPSDNLLAPEVRLGKDRLGKVSLGQDRLGQERQGAPRSFGGGWADGPARAHYGSLSRQRIAVSGLICAGNVGTFG